MFEPSEGETLRPLLGDGPEPLRTATADQSLPETVQVLRPPGAWAVPGAFLSAAARPPGRWNVPQRHFGSAR